jgi:hypothetical protein
MGPAPKGTIMHDSDQQPADTESDRAIHWIDRLCASAWVRVI